MSTTQERDNPRQIEIQPDGPYRVKGGIPLVRKVQVVSEHGEPLTWKKEGDIPTSGTYDLCRCGHSADKPFCDTTHREVDFDGAETADPRPTAERRKAYPGGKRIVVRKDNSLCIDAGFCGNRLAHISQLVPETGDSIVRAQVIAMVERCPSGSLTFTIEEGEVDIEPDLPEQIAVTTEITSDGPIAGPLWVTGRITIRRSDGEVLETRNRVTLCCCGKSKIKPLCDGSHRPGN